jgi:hypothetical protein
MRATCAALALAALAFLPAGCAVARVTGNAPYLEPPPADRSEPLTRDQVLREIERTKNHEDAIQALDDLRFAFVLDAATIEWFRVHDVAPEVLDYLRKRARVDWEGLRGDIDPRAPEAGDYVDPRFGFEDFAGVQARDHPERSHDAFSARVPSQFERSLGDR